MNGLPASPCTFPAIVRRRRWIWTFALILVAVTALLGLRATREELLRATGWALVVDEPIGSADVIVVAIAAVGGVLEAADLVHRGIAPRVAVFADPPDPVDLEFMRRGLPYDDSAARLTRQLLLLGVTVVEEIPRVDGTQSEGEVLPAWCQQHRFRSVVVLSSPDHSRRLRRVLRRAMTGHDTKVAIRVVHRWGFDPDRWWQTRFGVRTEIIELQKLLLDIVRHPLS
jgi:hypothetical protein